jgi:flavin reductase (DIM6/NTAB) family NADH-FMN oxidoreductase RutF
VDLNAKKKALRFITYGLYVATSRHGDEYAAGTVNWVSQCSFTPALVMAGIKVESRLHTMIAASGVFAIHIVGKAQKELATTFFKGAKREGDKLSGYKFEEGSSGAPILIDTPAWFECRVLEQIARGDHTVYVGEVVDAGVRREAEPLTLRDTAFFYGG